MNKKSKVVSLATTALIATLLLNANQAKADTVKKGVNDNNPKTSALETPNKNQNSKSEQTDEEGSAQKSVKNVEDATGKDVKKEIDNKKDTSDKHKNSKLDKAKQAVSDAQSKFDKDAIKTQEASKAINDARKKQLKYQSDFDSINELKFKAQRTDNVYEFAQDILDTPSNTDDFRNAAIFNAKESGKSIQELENSIKRTKNQIASGYAIIQNSNKYLDEYNQIINNAKSHPGTIDAEKVTDAQYEAIMIPESIDWNSINSSKEKQELSKQEFILSQFQTDKKMYDQLANSYNADQNTKLQLVNDIKNIRDQAKTAYEKVGGDSTLKAKKAILDQNKQNIDNLDDQQLFPADKEFENSYFALEKAEDQLADIISSEDNDSTDDNTNDNTSNNYNDNDNDDYFNHVIDDADQSTTSQDTNTSSTDNTAKKSDIKKSVKKQTKSVTKKNSKATSKKNTRKSSRKSSKSAARRSTKKNVKRAKTAVITIKHNKIYRNGKRLTNKQIRTLLAKKFNIKVKGTYKKHGFITTYDAKGRKMHKRFNLSKKYRILGFKMIHKTLYVRISKNTYVKYSSMFKK